MIASSRRSFITGLVSFVAAPAIVRAVNIMPVKAIREIVGADWRYVVRAVDIDITYVDGLSQSIVQTLFYGDPDAPPTEFVGFHHNVPIFQHDGILGG